jgi:hypothetical protein
MKFLRLVLFLVLTLALPAIGLVGVGTASRCGMTGMDSSSMAMAAMDCGQMNKAKAAQDGKANQHGDCKMDAACKTFSADPSLIRVFTLDPLPAMQTTPLQPALPVSTHDPDGLWRPPQGL